VILRLVGGHVQSTLINAAAALTGQLELEALPAEKTGDVSLVELFVKVKG